MIDKPHLGLVEGICNIGYWILKLRCIGKHICIQINQEGTTLEIEITQEQMR
jgi:hypothetical protein